MGEAVLAATLTFKPPRLHRRTDFTQAVEPVGEPAPAGGDFEPQSLPQVGVARVTSAHEMRKNGVD